MLAKTITSLISKLTGAFSATPIPKPFRSLVIGTFSRVFGIDSLEAEKPIDCYSSCREFFCRRLKEGARPLGSNLVCPIDGTLFSTSIVSSNTILSAKGEQLSVAELIGDPTIAQSLEGYQSYSFYLAPHNYHGVHIPLSGTIRQVIHMPGPLWPVNKLGTKYIPKLFLANERVSIFVDTPEGTLVVVMIGALNVGAMILDFEPTSPLSGSEISKIKYDPGVAITKGARLGVFALGSSVVLLAPSKQGRRNYDLPTSIKMGAEL